MMMGSGPRPLGQAPYPPYGELVESRESEAPGTVDAAATHVGATIDNLKPTLSPTKLGSSDAAGATANPSPSTAGAPTPHNPRLSDLRKLANPDLRSPQIAAPEEEEKQETEEQLVNEKPSGVQLVKDGCSWFMDGFTDFLVFWFGPMRFEHVEGKGRSDVEEVEFRKRMAFKHKCISGEKKLKKIDKQGNRLPREELGKKWAQLGRVRRKDPAKRKALQKKTSPKGDQERGVLGAAAHALGNAADAIGDAAADAGAQIRNRGEQAWDWIEERIGLDGDSDSSDDEFEFVPPRIPWFTVAWPTIAMLLWIGCSIYYGTDEGGLDSIWPQQTDLAISSDVCDDLRGQVWRWLSYQFTHVSFAHVGKNCLMMLILGWALEGASWSNDGTSTTGALRMFVMFNVGVFGGSCFYFLLDPHARTVGMSGGVYSMLGIAMADIVMNLETEHAFKILGGLCTMVVVDVAEAWASGATGVSHAAHLGGGIYGLLIGLLIGKNTKVLAWEKVVQRLTVVLMIVLTILCLAWLVLPGGVFLGPPRSIDEFVEGDPGWCWKGQVLNLTEFNDLNYHCVRCADKECIARWTNPVQRYSLSVDLAACQDNGWARSPPEA